MKTLLNLRNGMEFNRSKRSERRSGLRGSAAVSPRPAAADGNYRDDEISEPLDMLSAAAGRGRHSRAPGKSDSGLRYLRYLLFKSPALPGFSYPGDEFPSPSCLSTAAAGPGRHSRAPGKSTSGLRYLRYLLLRVSLLVTLLASPALLLT